MMQIQMRTFAHGPAVKEGEEILEYWLAPGITSTQYTLENEQVYDPVNEEERYYDEVTDGFYETERGKAVAETCLIPRAENEDDSCSAYGRD